MYYIFDKTGRKIASCDFEPNFEDLKTRDEVAVFSEVEINEDIRLVDGEIQIIEKIKVVLSKEELQSQVWEAIKNKRLKHCRSGIFVKSVNKWFHNDDSSRTQYLGLQLLPELPQDIVWKTMDNTFIPLNKGLVLEIAQTILTEEQHNFKNAEMHRGKMLEVENPLDYDYSSGWSEIYE